MSRVTYCGNFRHVFLWWIHLFYSKDVNTSMYEHLFALEVSAFHRFHCIGSTIEFQYSQISQRTKMSSISTVPWEMFRKQGTEGAREPVQLWSTSRTGVISALIGLGTTVQQLHIASSTASLCGGGGGAASCSSAVVFCIDSWPLRVRGESI